MGSIVVHGAVIAAAYRIPMPRQYMRGTVEFEIHRREAPVVAPITPPMAEEPKLASMGKRRGESAGPSVKAVPLQPMETVPKSSTPEEISPQATVPQRKGP